MNASPRGWARLGIVVVLLFFPGLARAQLDDRRVTIASAADAEQRRQALAGFVWGAGGFPAGRLPAATLDVPSPLPGLRNLRRVDELRTDMDAGEQGFAYHFVPQQANGRLVIVHNGHTCSFEGLGLDSLIDALLAARYAVLAVYMPHTRPGDCTEVEIHDRLFTDPRYAPAAGSPLRYFLEPVAASVNYLRARSQVDGFPLYREIDMVGLSGGGWTTTVYAAIDARIRLSFPVAGSIPLFSRAGGSVGDTEQFLEAFYRIAGYPDLYLLGARGPRRRQVWILNRHDSCCFGERPDLYADPAGRSWEQVMRGYEADVGLVLGSPGTDGSFRLVIDEASASHLISPGAIEEILAELGRGQRARPPAAPARR